MGGLLADWLNDKVHGHICVSIQPYLCECLVARILIIDFPVIYHNLKS